MKGILGTSSLLVGGIGMFLLAMKMITDGLKIAAGGALRDLLGRWTDTPGRGIRAGILITALVQSSSAVTVATIGFVNAGLLTMSRALGVIYGANVGTTMTGWLVAAVGFEFKLEALALPLVGAGMLLRLAGPRRRWGAFGEAVAGFGLFFIGIDILKSAFAGMATAADIARFTLPGVPGTLLLVAVGFVMTVLTQSSSAAIAITLTAATGGLIALAPAAAMVIGANLGTTSTAALAVIGATPNAKRVAGAHVIFNGVTGAVALALLPLLLGFVDTTGRVLGLEEAPAVTLALFHTTFNAIGVLLMWPATGRLAAFLERRFRSAEEERGTPRYLDRAVAVTPALALNALALELTHVLGVAVDLGRRAAAPGTPDAAALEADRAATERLTDAVGEFVSRMHGATLPEETVERLGQVVSASRHLIFAADLAAAVAQDESVATPRAAGPTAPAVSAFRRSVAEAIAGLDVAREGFSIEEAEAAAEANRRRYEELKEALLAEGTAARVRMSDLADLLEQLSNVRRLGERVLKAARVVHDLRAVVAPPRGAAPEEGGRAAAAEPPPARD